MPRAVRYRWPLLLAVSSLPIAVVVALATATMNGFLGLLIYPTLMVMSAFYGSWTETAADGFGAGFIATWGGYFLGLLFGVPVQYVLNPDMGWLGLALAVVVGAVTGFFFGLLFGLLGGVCGWAAAKVKLRLRPPTGAPPRAP